MPCDRGFGNLEIEYRKHRLHDPQDFFAAASKVKSAEVKKLCAEDMLDLKKLAQDHFKHNKAQNCLFSRCKRVFLSKNYPVEMVLECYNKDQKGFDQESVYLAVEDSDISKQKTTQEFQTYYLKQSGKTDTEQQDLLPTLRTSKFKDILPKKFKVGQVMVIGQKKLKDLKALKVFTHTEAKKWIQSVIDRQGEGGLRKKSQVQNDDAIYYDMENQEDEQDLAIDPEGAVVMIEDYHGEHTEDCEEPDTCETDKKPKKGKHSGGKKKQAGTGNLIIQLFISI